MRHRPRRGDVLDLKRNGIRLEDPNPDGQHPLPVLVAQEMIIGMFVTGSTISPLIVISTCITPPGSPDTLLRP